MPEPIVAEPVTPAVPDVTPESPVVLGTTPIFAPMTEEAPREPEAPATDPVVEPVNYSEMLEALSDEDLEALAPIKSLVARRNESTRRTTERQAAAESYTAQQQYAGSEAVIADLTAIAREAALSPDDNGNPQVAPDKISKAASAVMGRGVAVGINLLSRYLEEQAGESFVLTKAEQDQIEAAQVLYHQKPLDPTPLIRSWMTPFVRAQQENLRTELRAELAPQIRREEQERIKAEAAAAAGEARAGAPSPTPLNGASPSMAPPPAVLTTYIGISAALQRGQITEAQAQDAYAKIQ